MILPLVKKRVVVIFLTIAVIAMMSYLRFASEHVLHTKKMELGKMIGTQGEYSMRVPFGRGFEFVLGSSKPIPFGEITGKIRIDSQQGVVTNILLTTETLAEGTWLSSEGLSTLIVGRSTNKITLNLDSIMQREMEYRVSLMLDKPVSDEISIWFFYLQSDREFKQQANPTRQP